MTVGKDGGPVMYPDPLPGYVLENPLRSAECRIYELLRTQLGKGYTVFYSRPWLGLAPDGREVDGEADFVVAHQKYGILTLEVKGGAISHDAHTGEWSSRDRYGITHSIKNPVEQARTCKYRILEKLKSSPGFRHRFIGMHHGVVLPDSKRPSSDLGADMPLSIFAFTEDIPHLGAWVSERISLPQGGAESNPLGSDGMSALENILAKSFQLRSPLGAHLPTEERQILLLTDEQFQILDGLEGNTRYAVEGRAGTGKTLLAIEKARRLASAGMSTLLACYNRPLAAYLKKACSEISGVEVMTFHELCGSRARKAGIVIPAGTGSTYEADLPEALMSALDLQAGDRYDAIVVDEGQDFRAEWWVPLQLCLKDPEHGTLYVFYDNNQALYSGKGGFLSDIPHAPFSLTRNLRNTKRIFDAASPYVRPILRSAGPIGRDVEWVACPSPGKARDVVIEKASALISKEGIFPHDLAILTGTPSVATELTRGGYIGKWAVCLADDPQPGAIVMDTVRRFKGLEQSVVILTDLDSLLNDPELAYVGLTRARLHLIVVGTADEIRLLRRS